MLLAIDTTSDWGGVALYNQPGLLAEANWQIGRGHSAQILPMIHQLLANTATTVDDLTGVGVALGPGSWSGLRVGLSLAKGIALAANVPLLGVSSLDTLAYPHQRTGRSVMAVLRLGRDRFAVAEYRLRRAWGKVGAERNLSRDELLASLPELALVCGEIDVRLAAAIVATKGAGVVVPMPALSARRAGYLAEIAWGRLQAGERDDLVALEPTYLGNAVKEPAK
ncbi:MAG: tRNA (adenosine(37)-N6)-threonylcarbamoyltransferase complex dimerization subunit type 1 TsaB [Herpetosiphonaceae bacterium]|nr:tRNA (adenosine(37)-N6)-threonylcarbamoyltransferase complex dimerization subunit type 1 TsaB [Herpetosiphonaceae bacterium]